MVRASSVFCAALVALGFGSTAAAVPPIPDPSLLDFVVFALEDERDAIEDTLPGATPGPYERSELVLADDAGALLLADIRDAGLAIPPSAESLLELLPTPGSGIRLPAPREYDAAIERCCRPDRLAPRRRVRLRDVRRAAGIAHGSRRRSGRRDRIHGATGDRRTGRGGARAGHAVRAGPDRGAGERRRERSFDRARHRSGRRRARRATTGRDRPVRAPGDGDRTPRPGHRGHRAVTWPTPRSSRRHRLDRWPHRASQPPLVRPRCRGLRRTAATSPRRR